MYSVCNIGGYDYCYDTFEILNLPPQIVYPSGFEKFSFLFFGHLTVGYLIKIGKELCSSLDFLVYCGPGVRSPVLEDPSIYENGYQFRQMLPVFIEGQYDRNSSCLNASLTYHAVPGVIDIEQSITNTAEDDSKYCIDEGYSVKMVHPHQTVTFSISSFPNKNTWCALRVLWPWTFSAQLTFDGPNHYTQDASVHRCLYGGVYLEYLETIAQFCKTTEFPNGALPAHMVTLIFVQFLTGYSDGTATLTIKPERYN